MKDRYDQLADLWKSQETPALVPSLEVIKSKASKFERQIFWRNLREWSVAAVLVPVFVLVAWFLPGVLVKVGAVVLVIACFYISYRLYKHGRANLPTDPTLTSVEFRRAYRGQMLAQVSLLRTAPVWYVGPVAVGYTLMQLGYASNGAGTGDTLFSITLGVVVLGLVAWINLRAANLLKRQADRLLDE